MKKRILLVGLTTLLFSGQISVRFLENSMIEVTDPATGLTRVKTLHEPSEGSIRAWATERNVPILEIDPSTLDTTQWSGWFRYWTTLPLSNGFGNPLVVSDLDSNGRPEVYADYKSYTSDFESAIYEVDSSGSYTRLHTYPRLGATRQFADVDRNGLAEIVWLYGTHEYLFEQPAVRTLPTVSKLQVVRDSIVGSIGTGIFIGDLDGNGNTDFVNTGGIPDSATGNPLRKVFVREYNSAQSAFVTVWSTLFDQPLGNYGGFTAGDFDGDGKQEFQCVEIKGKVYLVESQGIHSYTRTWSDSTPFVNLFYQTSGDIDRNGKPEFYVGATMSNGNWTTMYEADSNDHYSPRFIFHLLSGGSLDEPTYLTPDVDQDGKPELLILSGADLYIFKSDGNDSFYLWYYKRFDAKQSIQFYDFNRDGKQDFILSRARQDSLFRLALFSDIYLAERFTHVVQSNVKSQVRLLENYPNPFNATTTIRFALTAKGKVSLRIYDLLGREVCLLSDAFEEVGEHSIVWHADRVSSGIYLCVFKSTNQTMVRKLLLLR